MELKIPPLVQVLVIGMGMLGISKLLPSYEVLVPGSVIAGLILMVAGTTLAIVGVVEFGRLDATVDPRHPQNATRLVAAGIYKISRNPMYLGMLILLLGWSVFLTNVVSFVLVPVFVVYMNYFQIGPEERILSEKFGSEYIRYCRKVRRWI